MTNERPEDAIDQESGRTRTEFARLSIMAAIALISWLGPRQPALLFDAVAVAATLVGGYPVYLETFRALMHRQINMEVSMAVAIFASLALEQFTAAVVVTFFVLLSEYIERYAVDKGRATIAKLERSVPRTAMVRRGGALVETEIQGIRPNELVIVRDGERVPVDGKVSSGTASVDQGPITGESVPVDKAAGDYVYAGSVNVSGLFEIKTEKVGSETTFGKIIKLVEDAENKKAPIQRISDVLAARLVEFSIVFAIITFIVTRNVTSTLSVVVVAGACGVAAGTPLAIVATMGFLAKRGVIVKGGIHIQRMSQVDTVVIDKTGTLTFGEPEVKEIVAMDGFTQLEVLAFAAAAEKLSRHPLARAITSKAKELALSSNASDIGPSDYVAGKGIVSLYEGERVVVGNALFMAEHKIYLPRQVDSTLEALTSKGMTTVLVARRGEISGIIGISDRVRTGSRRAIEELKRLRISTVMLTGDNRVVARLVGDEVGIEEAYSNLLPQDKVTIVENLVRNGHKVAMVGDGINDAPALARADVGIGMGGGTDIAIEEADIVLMTNDLERVSTVARMSKKAFRTIMTNFYGTLIVDGIGITLAFLGLLNPLLAAGIHVVSELIFILNSARLIR